MISLVLITFSSSKFSPKTGTEDAQEEEEVKKTTSVKTFLCFRSDRHIPMLIVFQGKIIIAIIGLVRN
jgi:hypothetical protein